MKKYVLYHGGGCTDGFGSAFSAWLKFGDDAEYIPVLYGKMPPVMEPDSEVYILDFSYPAKTLAILAGTHKKVVVLDHHATAQNELTQEAIDAALPEGWIVSSLVEQWIHAAIAGTETRLSIQFDMKRSGAVLAFNYFFPGDATPEFFLYLQDRDLWAFKLDQSREISAALKSYPMDFNVWDNLYQSYDWWDQMVQDGEACLRLTNQQVAIMADNFLWVHFQYENVNQPAVYFLIQNDFGASIQVAGGWIVPCANATVFFSEVGEKLLQNHPEAPFAAYFLERKDGARQWGLRSRPEFDCSVVAKAFGGGGHPAASGFLQMM